MPSSLEGEHCEICPFADVDPTDDVITAAVEDVAVRTYLFDSTALREPHGVSPGAEDQGLTERRDGAARACADCIVRNTCLFYVYRRDPVHSMYQLGSRHPDML